MDAVLYSEACLYFSVLRFLSFSLTVLYVCSRLEYTSLYELIPPPDTCSILCPIKSIPFCWASKLAAWKSPWISLCLLLPPISIRSSALVYIGNCEHLLLIHCCQDVWGTGFSSNSILAFVYRSTAPDMILLEYESVPVSLCWCSSNLLHCFQKEIEASLSRDPCCDLSIPPPPISLASQLASFRLPENQDSAFLNLLQFHKWTNLFPVFTLRYQLGKEIFPVCKPQGTTETR